MRFSKFSIKKLAGVAAAIAILPVAVACDTANVETTEEAEVAPDAEVAEVETDLEVGTIVDVAASSGSFETLVAALQAAELVDTLSNEGPYTVFAPTDAAFAALPEGLLEKLLLPENKDVLTEILAYHVVPAEVLAADIVTGPVETVGGAELAVVSDAGVVTVNEVAVSAADVVASNGVIHVIDEVLVPPTVDVSAL